tara:strand:+ start:160 stop:1092 length:933 start_codon:yes stop_codon:yes gene_type:complete
MQTVLSITIPFFAIIFLGTFFSANKVFNNESAKNLTKYALYITLPPYIFLNILKSSNSVIFNWNFIIRFEIITLLILILSFFLSKKIYHNSQKESAIFALNAAWPNYGYMGIPLCILAFGEEASIPISLIFLFDIFILVSFTSIFASNEKSNHFIYSLFFAFIRILINPILISVFIGFIFLIYKIQINSILYKFLETLSLGATPTALFAIGITLWNKIETKSKKDIFTISIIKLVLHPILITSIFYFVPSNIPSLWIKIAILCSCLPVAGNVFAMSIYYNSLIKVTASSTLITTILSTFTVPIVLYLLIN